MCNGTYFRTQNTECSSSKICFDEQSRLMTHTHTSAELITTVFATIPLKALKHTALGILQLQTSQMTVFKKCFNDKLGAKTKFVWFIV